MPIQKLKNYLDSHNIKYVTMSHSPAYTSPEIAAAAHIPGQILAKTIMVIIDGEMVMTVMPSNYRVDLDLLQYQLGAERVDLATEDEFRNMFPDCEIGAMPPFGNIYGMEVIVSDTLTVDKEIAFNAGTHRELMRLAYKDFERLVKPRVMSFTYKQAKAA